MERNSVLENLEQKGSKRIISGIIFSIFGILIYLANINENDGGVIFIYISIFFGGGQIVMGLMMFLSHRIREARLRYFRNLGTLILAEAMEDKNSFFNLRIKAKYKDDDGKEYVFASPSLWMFPIPYLKNGEVKVFHKPNNMNIYIVDVDGSIDESIRIPSEHFKK